MNWSSSGTKKQNEEIKKGFGELSGFMRKDYRREMISQAINKTGAVQK